jgi:hypothetical protein
MLNVGLDVGMETSSMTKFFGATMLSDVQARRIKPGDKPIAVGGVPGLFLKAGSIPGRGNFILRFFSPKT